MLLLFNPELLMPEFEAEELKNLKIVVFPARKIGVDDPFYLSRTKQTPPLDRLFGEQIVDERSQRPA